MANLAKKLLKLPVSPGVYFFKNKAGEIIYIGKAGNLRNRVRSYFNKGAKFSSAAPTSLKLRGASKVKMLTEIADLEILKTDSEISALITESRFIKKHKPRFNVLMRDSKNYLSVSFSGEKFSKIILTHQPQSLNTKYKLLTTDFIGPFTDSGAVRKTLAVLRDIFPYCTCKRKHNTKCLNGHLGRCLVFCCLKSTDLARASDRMLMLNKYRQNIKAIRTVLSGHSRLVLRSLKKEIRMAINRQNFETARELKHKIENLESVLNHAQVLEKKYAASPPIFQDTKPNFKLLGFKKNPQRIEMYDISNFQGQAAVGSMVVFKPDKNGEYKADKNEYRRFKIKTITGINDPAMMAEVIKRRLNHESWPWPQLIIVDGGRAQLNAAIKSLGHKKIRLVSLAKKLEEIYLPERAEPVLASKFGQYLEHLFQAIRDEAHRFAVSYHRKLHRQKTLTQ